MQNVEVLLLVVEDVAGDPRFAKVAQLEQPLREVGQEARSAQHLRGLRDLAVDAQPEPVEDVANVHARPCREGSLLDRDLTGSQDLLVVETREPHSDRWLVLPAMAVGLRSSSSLPYSSCAITVVDDPTRL
ncbi:MAG: hypothetical protein JW751_30775 [Polyangiaceae bacterium]|nr:hypothetical protein [Polyangiaceae bacterium]